MLDQTYTQRHAQKSYCAVQREARTQPWMGDGVGYTPAAPEPDLDPQPAAWAGELTFLLLVLVAIAFLLGMAVGGSHEH